MKRRLPAVFYNRTTLFGMMIATVMLFATLSLIAIDALAGFSNNYLGLITYIALPSGMLFGLFIAAIGVIRSRRRAKRGGQESDLPVIDLNRPAHRKAVSLIGFGGLVMMALSGFGSSQAYEYTESVKFCGTTCHAVMKPEYTAYQNSPHARVACVTCHIGSGTDFYVKSKLSGAYQVYSVLFNKYHRPIQTPVHNLRPAKETCEQCHWPKNFFSQKLRDHNYFMKDADNSPYQVTMLVKVGGTHQGASEGIHAHMYLDNKISYISTDRQRQVIPYVEQRSPDGKVTIYRDTESKATEADLKKGEHRTVDCIDCHNRPSHQYNHPDTTVDAAISQGVIDRSLHDIKSTSVDALEGTYKTESAAKLGIEKAVRDAYKDTPANSPDKAKIDNAVKALQFIYSQNYFPEMKTDWKGFPNNLDHIHSLGCFRCHDDKHKSDSGKVISKNCTSCHVIVGQGTPGPKRETNLNGLVFKHPVDIGDDWKTTPCKNCHGDVPK